MGAAQLTPIKVESLQKPLLVAESFPDRVLREVPLKTPEIFSLVRSQREQKCCQGGRASSWEAHFGVLDKAASFLLGPGWQNHL